MKELEQALQGKRVILKAARRAGKTTTAIKWARNHGGRVIFVVPYSSMVRLIVNALEFEYSEEIEAIKLNGNEAIVLFKDDAEIRVMAGRYENAGHLKGLRADAIVFDDINHINEGDAIGMLTAVVHKEDFSIFATSTGDERGGYKLLKGLDKVAPLETISIDYLDLIENGRLSAGDIRYLIDKMSESTFKKEMGPFKKEFQLRRNNAFFKHLLKKE